MQCECEKTADFLVDWFSPSVTADLPGGYRQPGTGEETCARWSFVMDEAPREIR